MDIGRRDPRMDFEMRDLFTKWGIDRTQTIGMIFDIDELLFDNSHEIFLAYRALLDSRNIIMDIDETFLGKNLFDITTRIKIKYNIAESVEALIEERKMAYIELLKRTKSGIKDGVKELFHFFDQNRHRLNVRLGYATSSERVFSDIVLKKIFQSCALEDYVNDCNKFFYCKYNSYITSTCWEPGLEKKPSPMLYNLTIEKMGLPPEQCIAFEDSRSGLLAALAANLNVVIVPSCSEEEIFRGLDKDPFFRKKVCKMDSLLNFLPVLKSHLLINGR
ncbi:MAG: HAD family hydrolase [Planctomycetota bacterium]|jgi:beta-phosphoglucomutase-like phosphatase (HAD superfamily)